MIEFNEFSVLLHELNSTTTWPLEVEINVILLKCNPKIKIYHNLIDYIILFFCLHQSDLLNWVENDIFHIL